MDVQERWLRYKLGRFGRGQRQSVTSKPERDTPPWHHFYSNAACDGGKIRPRASGFLWPSGTSASPVPPPAFSPPLKAPPRHGLCGHARVGVGQHGDEQVEQQDGGHDGEDEVEDDLGARAWAWARA